MASPILQIKSLGPERLCALPKVKRQRAAGLGPEPPCLGAKPSPGWFGLDSVRFEWHVRTGHSPISRWKRKTEVQRNEHKGHLRYFQSCFWEQFHEEGVGRVAKISILRKEKGNKELDKFLRLKIGLSLELSWEKPEQMKSHKLLSGTWLGAPSARLRDTDWLSSTALLFWLSFPTGHALKAIKVTMHSLKNVPCNFIGASSYGSICQHGW